MVEIVSAILRTLPLWLAALALPSAIVAHPLDEYVQATLVSIEPAGIHLQINLTPGVNVADKVLALIDRDHNGAITDDEAAAYAASLQGDLTVRLDHRIVGLKLDASKFPEPSELRTGWGIIQLDFELVHEPLTAGRHILTLDNNHLAAISVYLINAEQPESALVKITAQKRNETQSLGQIDFDYALAMNPAKPRRNIASVFGALALIAAAVGLVAIGVRRSRPHKSPALG